MQQLLYVDRVVLYKRYVPRSVPVIREWDTNFLFERQVLEIDAGGFGLGFIEDAFMELNDDAGQEYQGADVAIAAIEYGEPSNAETSNAKRLPRCRSPTVKDKQSIAQMIIEHSKTITTSMQAILDLVNDLPNEMLNDSLFKRMIDAALMVTKADPSTSPAQNTHKSSSQSDDEFWACPEHINAIIEMEQAALRRDAFKKMMADDAPSFSIGLTQEEQNEKWNQILKVSGLYEVVYATENMDDEINEEMAEGEDTETENEEVHLILASHVFHSSTVLITPRHDMASDNHMNHITQQIQRTTCKLTRNEKELYCWLMDNDESIL